MRMHTYTCAISISLHGSFQGFLETHLLQSSLGKQLASYAYVVVL